MKGPTKQEETEFKTSPELRSVDQEADSRIKERDFGILDDYPRLIEEAWTKFLRRTRRAKSNLRLVPSEESK